MDTEKYQVKSEIDHVLDRSGMWLGSVDTEVIDYPVYMPSKNKIQTLNVGYNAALNKLIDEVLSNSIDEYRRSKSFKKDSLFDITKISVVVNSDGFVEVYDNGGIPVQVHKETGIMIPELIFGHLRTSSNYDDTQEREVVGTNGLGAKLTNIFSKEFTVHTADGNKEYKCTWSNNMKDISEPEIKDTKQHFTRISFKIDLERFELTDLSVATARIIQKRCIDAAAANPGLIIDFNSDVADGKLNSSWKFDSFQEYIALYIDKELIDKSLVYKSNKDIIMIVPDSDCNNVGFVNGAICSEGTHIKKIQSQVCDKILDLCKKDDMELITEKDIIARMGVFVNCTITNPKYDSQAKNRLTSKLDRFQLAFDDKFLSKLKDSELYESIKAFYNIKYAEQKRKETRKLNATIKSTRSKKIIQAAAKDPKINELWIFEGNSASNGFRKGRNLYQSGYLLRGKIKNTLNLSREQIIENQELREILAVSGLQFNEPQKNIKNCAFSKFIFATDMDVDGHHIAGLLIAFFAKHFPELFRNDKIYRALSPIVVANPHSKKDPTRYFYTLEDYHREEKTLKNYEIIYTKGLGGLSDHDYKQMLRNQKLIKFDLKDAEDMETINIWFDKSTEMRKQILLEDSNGELDD